MKHFNDFKHNLVVRWLNGELPFCYLNAQFHIINTETQIKKDELEIKRDTNLIMAQNHD